jgi:hypothetical protein
MKSEQFIMDIYALLLREMELVLKDLTPAQLNYRPGPQSNSIGWLVWHTARSQDRMNADLFGEDQLWIKDQWYYKFTREADPKDTGFGHTAEQVSAFRAPDAATCLSYYQAVSARTREYVSTRLSPADLDREVFSQSLGVSRTVEARLLMTIGNLQHIGQAGYVKGLQKGIGWYGI